MNSTNNFNVCPRCGTANSMVAKYCFQCGAQLKISEKPIVCGKCNTVNSSMATFCKTCGSRLRTDKQTTKICPRCANTVEIGASLCTKCGYSFNSVTEVAPSRSNETAAAARVGKVRVKSTALGATRARVGGIFAMLFALLLAYLVVMPDFMAIKALNFGIFWRMSDSVVLTGYNILAELGNGMINGNLSTVLANYSVDYYMILATLVLTLALALVEFFVGLYRLISGNLAKNKNAYSLAMFIILLFVTAFLYLTQSAPSMIIDLNDGVWKNLLTKIASLNTTWLRYGYYIMVGYHFVVFILSLIFKKKSTKDMMQISRD